MAIRRHGGVPGHITEARVGVTLDDLIERISRSEEEQAVWAVDVPFGRPEGFSEFLTRHRAGPTTLNPRVGLSGAAWAGISHRETDREVEGRAGFSVSFDKLGATAAAWSMVEQGLHHLKEITLDRSGLTGRVVETYPSAAWRVWGFDSRPAAKDSWDAARGRLVDQQVIDLGEHRDALAGDENIRDALACALVARARALGLTRGPRSDLDQAAHCEGWIHLPQPKSLTQLGARAR